MSDSAEPLGIVKMLPATTQVPAGPPPLSTPTQAAGPAGPEEDEIREQDRFLPIANVARIMKRTLPDTAKIAKDAKECVQECVSEFIAFITSEASERCHMEKRKTINGEDILWAMQNLGFDNYHDTLKLHLNKCREQSSRVMSKEDSVALHFQQQTQYDAQQKYYQKVLNTNKTLPG